MTARFDKRAAQALKAAATILADQHPIEEGVSMRATESQHHNFAEWSKRQEEVTAAHAAQLGAQLRPPQAGLAIEAAPVIELPAKLVPSIAPTGELDSLVDRMNTLAVTIGTLEPSRVIQEPSFAMMQLLTPALAHQILDQCRHPTQRDRKQDHIEYLKDQVKRGRFTAESIAFAFVPGKGYLLIDGQHRLQVVAELGLAYRFVVMVYYGISFDESKVLYSRFNRGRQRTQREATAALDREWSQALTGYQYQVLVTASVFIAQNFHTYVAGSSLGKSAEARDETAQPWSKVGHQVFEMLRGDGNITKKMHTKPYLALALVTMADCKEKAEPFWEAVCKNDRIGRETAEFHMVQSLLEQNAVTRKADNASAMNAEYLLRVAAWCWNLHFRGKTAKRIDVVTRLRILGTRFKSGVEDRDD